MGVSRIVFSLEAAGKEECRVACLLCYSFHSFPLYTSGMPGLTRYLKNDICPSKSFGQVSLTLYVVHFFLNKNASCRIERLHVFEGGPWYHNNLFPDNNITTLHRFSDWCS
jgi:hypothetical protein